MINGLSIFLYHRVLPEAKFNPLQTIVTVKEFEKQLDDIASRHEMISMSEALKKIHEKIPFKNHAVLSFDDGYRDNYEIVFPILKKKGIPALFSIVTNYIGSGRPLWDWEILLLLSSQCWSSRHLSSRHLSSRRWSSRRWSSRRWSSRRWSSRRWSSRAQRGISIGKENLWRRFFEHPIAFGYRIIERLKVASLPEIEDVIEQLKEIPRANALGMTGDALGMTGDALGMTGDALGTIMTWDEIITLHRHGMEIASHSLSHRSLARIPFDEAIKEISESKHILEKETGGPCHYFSFPFGSKRDISEILQKKTENAGYLGSLLNIHGTNDMTTDPFGFKRIIMK